jgi:hypothetical protein
MSLKDKKQLKSEQFVLSEMGKLLGDKCTKLLKENS